MTSFTDSFLLSICAHHGARQSCSTVAAPTECYVHLTAVACEMENRVQKFNLQTNKATRFIDNRVHHMVEHVLAPRESSLRINLVSANTTDLS